MLLSPWEWVRLIIMNVTHSIRLLYIKKLAGFCRCNQVPKSVYFHFIRKEISPVSLWKELDSSWRKGLKGWDRERALCQGLENAARSFEWSPNNSHQGKLRLLCCSHRNWVLPATDYFGNKSLIQLRGANTAGWFQPSSFQPLVENLTKMWGFLTHELCYIRFVSF